MNPEGWLDLKDNRIEHKIEGLLHVIWTKLNHPDAVGRVSRSKAMSRGLLNNAEVPMPLM
jgi:hypothetical protein